ncbi:TIGR03086 family protein [Amycolatopsis sp. NBRC 101858]|uniref:TIGR03086 family metal-binding protein n=1 Tax=Amycolatopsis sp. NBRC 101858 TaxID=3032200 RepID=UPI0024A36A23|nr:TIGR03086 family metal-binding protein [Amycolatopsis sp. NBRC 101858]GLY42473.1 TIGR03086 family protein [Amycolatopsis sp. NBRC 101858]
MDLRELDRRSLLVLDKIVATATPADLARPTPCAGWTLADLLRHQVSENHAFATAAREGSAPDWDAGDLGDDAHAAYRASVDDFLDAMADDAVLERQLTINHFGTFPGTIAAHMHLVDTVAHGWDLARTLGLAYEPDAEAVSAALQLAEHIPDEGREKNGSFAHRVTTEADASELDRFLALLGRDPAWTVS